MPEKKYFLSFVYTDQKHLRSNRFYHSCFVFLEGTKNDQNQLQDLKALDSYGYYSHVLGKNAQRNWLEKMTGTNLRLTGSYAELKQEKLTEIDLGFGLTGGPIIEITESEKDRLEQQIKTTLEQQKQFFSEPDKLTHKLVEESGITDPKKKKAFFNQTQTELREKYYKKQLDQVNAQTAQSDFLVEDVSEQSNIISEYRLKQEKLKTLKGIAIFEGGLGPHAATCKTNAFNFVIDNLDHDESGKVRKQFLAKLQNDYYYTQSIPILSGDSSKVITQTSQTNYQPTPTKPPFPARTWEDKDVNCELIAYEKNTYIDLSGKEQTIKIIDKQAEYFTVLENLIHLKRLLNDFCSGPLVEPYQQFLKKMDKTIHACTEHANDIHAVIKLYHQCLLKLKFQGCFDSISQDILQTNQPLHLIPDIAKHIKQKHIRVEDGLLVEISRLKQLKEHADKFVLTYDNFSNTRPYFAFFGNLMNKNIPEDYELQERPQLL